MHPKLLINLEKEANFYIKLENIILNQRIPLFTPDYFSF